MSNYSALKATLNANIRENNNEEITGQILNGVLNDMVNALGAGYQFIGVATPTNPGSDQTPDYKCFYIATTPGAYSHLGGLVVEDGEVALLKWDTTWTKEVTGIASADQLRQVDQKVDNLFGETTADFSIVDKNQMQIVEFSDGEIKTKKFDSRDVPVSRDNIEDDFAIEDEDGNKIVSFFSGHIRTKKFNSKAISDEDTDKKFIFCIGDSITAGAGAQYNYDGTTIPTAQRKGYPTLLQEMNTPYLFEKYGQIAYGGENTLEIMARAGVEPFCTKYEYTLPADTTAIPIEIVSSYADDVTLTFQVQNHAAARNPVYISGVKCNFNIVSDGIYTINRLESGTSIKIPANTPVIPEFSTATPKGLIVFCGTNDDTNLDIDTYIQCIKDADTHFHTDGNFVCMTPFRLGSVSLATRMAQEKKMRKAFGCHYFNLREYFATQAIYDALDNGYITGAFPTAQDLADMASGTAPTTLISDGTHPNAQGYMVIAYKLNQLINELNIISK